MNFNNSETWRMRFLTAIATTAFFVSVAANAEVALGDSHAPVTIVEYGSLTCSYCVRFHREVLPLIHSRHIKTGKVRFIYRDFPTSTAATRGAIAARCAGPERYYMMLDALYAAVGTWSKARDIEAALIRHAALLGVDAVMFRACLEDPKHVANIRVQLRRAQLEYDVVGTLDKGLSHVGKSLTFESVNSWRIYDP